MTAFGDLTHQNLTGTDQLTGKQPADTGLSTKAGYTNLVEQAWSFSPANYITQGSTGDLPRAGYGAGARARQETVPNNDIQATSGDASQMPTGPRPQVINIEGKTLRSILPSMGMSGRPLESVASQTTSQRPIDLIDALIAADVQTAKVELPKPEVARPEVFKPEVFKPEVVKQDFFHPPTNTGLASAELVSVQALAKPGRSVDFDVKANPLLANLNKDAKPKSFENYNARMEKSASFEDLSRQTMVQDFRLPTTRNMDLLASANRANDPFQADNCYQQMEISPDGRVKTTTTLPDLSASKVECRFPDKSSTVALTDHLGRETITQCLDANGQLVSQTNYSFDNAAAPMSASQKTVKTATQTIDTRMDAAGTVVASKVMPYSDLHASKMTS